jgi:predicted permease
MRWAAPLLGDARFAFRYFARHKATTAIIVAVLALGTGANTLIFSTLQAVFLRPAPGVPEDDTRARIWAQERASRGARWEPRLFSQPELAALAERREVFRDVAAWVEHPVILDGSDSTGARSVTAQFVTPNFFPALGVRLAAGQGFRRDAGDVGGTPDLTAVMAHATAERLYGDAASAVGRRILVNEVPVHVVGVAPPRFQGAMRDMVNPVLWIPVGALAEIARVSPRWLVDEAALSLFARLAPGASREQAAAFTQQVMARALPDSAARVGMARTAHVRSMQAQPPGSGKFEMVAAFVALLALGVLILLVGWLNVSALMVAAAVGRRQEIAVRLSLGASRPRLLRQLVTESTLLALAGSLVGLLVAWGALTYMAQTGFDEVDLAPDLGTLTFVLAMAMTTGILFGLSPALHAIRDGMAGALRDSSARGGSRSRLQRGFVVAQIALSQPLLVLLGAMLSMIITDYKPLSREMSRHVIAVGLRPLATGAPEQRPDAVDRLVPRIAARPEVLAAVPDAEAFSIRGLVVPGGTRPDSAPTIAHLEGAAPGWFALVEVPIILGRDVSLADTADEAHPIVIGSDVARRLWGGANPIGRTLASPGLPGLAQDSMSMTVVGVFDATRKLPGMTFGGSAATTTNVPARVYTAHGAHWRRDRILVRTHGPAAPLVPELRRFVRAAAPSMPVTSVMTLEQIDEREYLVTLRMAALAGAGGALALLLASLGLYGVVSLSVRQRTREIGIRIAVGAYPMKVARMFLAAGVRTSLVALALGLPLSIAALKISISEGVIIAPQVNPYLIGFVIAPILLLVAAAATWVPAKRAALVDPARTLRAE